MKKFTIALVIIMGLVTAALLNSVDNDIMNAFPTLDGWSKKGATATYTPDNLYEYINGAADVFLSYDFQKLASLTYVENGKKGSFSVDIYLHSNEKNCFGIYTQERPVANGNYLPIGAQGYYEKGVLNFMKGNYYVKLSGYDLGEEDKKVLISAANDIASRLHGSTGFPTVLSCFPEQGKIKDSEKYIAQNFLGHSFLHSAFVTEYDLNGQKSQVFIIETDDSNETNTILQKYRDFLKKKGGNETAGNSSIRIQDPYYQASGTLFLKTSGNYIWGLFSTDNQNAESIINRIESNLKQNKLI